MQISGCFCGCLSEKLHAHRGTLARNTLYVIQFKAEFIQNTCSFDITVACLRRFRICPVGALDGLSMSPISPVSDDLYMVEL